VRPSPELLDDLVTASAPDGVDARLVLGDFGLRQVDGVSFLFEGAFPREVLVPGYVERHLGNDTAIFYPMSQRDGATLPLTEDIEREIRDGLSDPEGYIDYGGMHVHWLWGTGYPTYEDAPVDGFERAVRLHYERWVERRADGIAPVILARFRDQVREIRHEAWLFTAEEAKDHRIG
jgi:hypothetical protein